MKLTKMQRYLISSILAIALLAPSLAGAHDAKLHKGKATVGEVVSIAPGKMELKTATGPVTVTLNDKTKYEHGNQTVEGPEGQRLRHKACHRGIDRPRNSDRRRGFPRRT